MSYGFQVYNASGLIQADDTYSNYAIYQSGSVSIGANTTAALSFTNVGVVPLLFLRIGDSSNRVGIDSISTTGATLRTANTNSGSVTVEWYTAVPTNYVSVSGTYGLTVMNASGAVTFDSRYKYPRFRSILSFTPSSSSQTINFSAMPDSSRPYFCANMVSGIVGTAQISGSQFMLLLIQVGQPSNTSFTVQEVGYGPLAGTPGSQGYGLSKQFVVAMQSPT
jgi:hypothetical protein